MRLAERIYKDVVCKIAETFKGDVEAWHDMLLNIKDLANNAERIWKEEEFIPPAIARMESKEHGI